MPILHNQVVLDLPNVVSDFSAQLRQEVNYRFGPSLTQQLFLDQRIFMQYYKLFRGLVPQADTRALFLWQVISLDGPLSVFAAVPRFDLTKHLKTWASRPEFKTVVKQELARVGNVPSFGLGGIEYQQAQSDFTEHLENLDGQTAQLMYSLAYFSTPPATCQNQANQVSCTWQHSRAKSLAYAKLRQLAIERVTLNRLQQQIHAFSELQKQPKDKHGRTQVPVSFELLGRSFQSILYSHQEQVQAANDLSNFQRIAQLIDYA